jgi:hypothetical protein
MFNMGYNYYAYYKICIKCSDGSVNEYILNDIYLRHYYHDIGCRYEDLEEDEEYINKWRTWCEKQIEEELMQYKTRNLFFENEWLCAPTSVKKYRKILKVLNLSERNINHIWKQGDFLRKSLQKLL